jgi:hypothetical protein
MPAPPKQGNGTFMHVQTGVHTMFIQAMDASNDVSMSLLLDCLLRLCSANKEYPKQGRRLGINTCVHRMGGGVCRLLSVLEVAP